MMKSCIPDGIAWRALQGVLTAALLLCVSATTHAVTIANWNFEDGTDGAEFTPAGAENGSGGSVDTASGILMRGYNEQYGAAFTSQTASGSGLAMNLEINPGAGDTTSDGYVTEGALHNWSPTAWTIETTVNLRNVDGWRTLIGRDGSSSTPAEPESDFYLQKNNIDGRFRVNFDTVGGQRWVLDGALEDGVQANTWYAIAVVSDGQNLSMWVDDGFQGYQQVGTVDMSAQTAANNALRPSAAGWTFGRGWYNGGFVDHVDGIMDNIKFSDTALTPAEFVGLDLAANTLTLVVNPDTGEASLKNNSSEEISFDYYRIDSPTDGALLTANYNGTTGWNSLSDQNTDSIGPNPGQSWDEVSGVTSANLLVEQFLLGDTTLAPGASVSLGAPISTSLLGEDLEFRFSSVGGPLMRSLVVFDAGGAVEGDFNGDGVVNLADYTVWRDNLGAVEDDTVLSGNGNGGVVDATDYQLWKTNFGAGGAGAIVAGAASVPEPATLIVAGLMVLGAAWRRR
ncbi:LamG-like jellyroll fold domain-containing protein [Aeoliella sp. SH292]|uniref:LamG-like jellyroll fold domain-containing protein n=1 Tax=Aeoliella sp. SH292 TaxID=3454464 RepID=UPI003F9D468A